MSRYDRRPALPRRTAPRRVLASLRGWPRMVPAGCLVALCLCLATLPASPQPSGGPYGPLRQIYALPKAGHVYYVAPDGKPAAAGSTVSEPTTVESAIARVVTGDAMQITGYYPAAVKIFNQSYRVTCRENLVIDQPYSNGIWYDVGNVDGVFVNNWVEGALDGFFFEISKGAICAGNVFVRCDKGVRVLNSSNVQVYHNTFVDTVASFERTERSAVGDHFGLRHTRTVSAITCRSVRVLSVSGSGNVRSLRPRPGRLVAIVPAIVAMTPREGRCCRPAGRPAGAGSPKTPFCSLRRPGPAPGPDSPRIRRRRPGRRNGPNTPIVFPDGVFRRLYALEAEPAVRNCGAWWWKRVSGRASPLAPS